MRSAVSAPGGRRLGTSSRTPGRRLVAALILFACGAALGGGASQAAHPEPGPRRLPGPSLHAPPAPTTGARALPEAVSGSHASRWMVTRDLATGRGSAAPPAAGPGDGAPEQTGEMRGPPKNATRPLPDARGEPSATPVGESAGAARPVVACAPPSPSLATHSPPWNQTFKLILRYRVGENDFYHSCSAVVMGSFHLLTAAHCIYSHDPNGDGSTDDARWADEVWAWAAQTDYVNPHMGDPGAEDHPYGFAKATSLTTYAGWVDSADLNHDLGYVTLDRRQGDHTGWMGLEAGTEAVELEFNGYPTETPFVPAGEIRQHPGAGGSLAYSTYRINMCAFTYGGHGGGPVWRNAGSERYIQGVLSTSDGSGAATATRLTTDRLADIEALILDDEAGLAPARRPDLAEHVWSPADEAKDLLTNTTRQGRDIQVEYNVLNAGFRPSGTITVSFYLSLDKIISDLDYPIGSKELTSLSAWTYVTPTASLTVPFSQPPGTYYLGWILEGAEPEYEGDLDCGGAPCGNVALIADETLVVLESTCTQDVWEPDDFAAQASGISSGVAQSHSICPLDDEDYVGFTLESPSAVVLETSPPAAESDDTWIYLYDASLVVWDFDSGPGYSRIEAACGEDELPPGGYYLRILEGGGDEEIEYSVEYTLVEICCPDHAALADRTLAGVHTYFAGISATLGPNLACHGSPVEVISRSIRIGNGTEIGGTFVATSTTGNPCP